MRTSGNSHRSACSGRGPWMKINFPIFKDEKMKDAVTYCSCQWGMAIFHQSGWDDQHLLPYVFHSLQGFMANLAWSLGKDATLSDVLQMLDDHYGVIMMFDALSKELYSLKQGFGECSWIWDASVTAGPDTPVRVPRKDSAWTCGGDEAWPLLWGP